MKQDAPKVRQLVHLHLHIFSTQGTWATDATVAS
jgi:hypothetical protein